MDTQSDSSGALDTIQAASAIADLLSPPEEQDKAQVAAAPEHEEQAPAQDAEQATPDAEQDPQQDDDPVVTIKVDGKDVEVKLSELKRGYQKDAAANQRFEQAAELRKQADAESQRARAERQQYGQGLQQVRSLLEGQLQQQQQIDWDALKQADPVEFVNQVRLAQERQANYQRVLAEQGQLQAVQQAEDLDAQRARLHEQHDVLLEKVPEWKDATKAKAERAQLKEYLKSQGFDEQSVSNIADARAVVMARKAMLYDHLMQKASVASKKVVTLPTKVERAGNGADPGLDKRSSAFQKLSKSGRVEDAAAVFAGLL